MNKNILAIGTLKYIWSHPNCQTKRILSILKFFTWQLYKRITNKYIDIQVIPSVKVRCYPDGYSAATVMYCGLYDYNEMNFLLRYLRPNDSFLDIGANIGIYTLLAASKIESSSIYSFEVLPKNYNRLEENLKINQFQHVQTYQVAISDITGSIALNIAEGDSMPFITNTSTDTNKTIQVSTDTLDNLLQNQSLSNLTLAKMDIEGAELLAFKGAKLLLKQQRPTVWILEVNDAVNNFGHKKQDVIDLLQFYGYGLYTYDAEINQIKSINLEQQQGNNVLAIANSHIDFVCNRLGTKILINKFYPSETVSSPS
ncbi:MAG: FkbM family methyltransferase [Scytonematopsis contorta HA4267-MV1]|jgi:FkbM family methyltransferase|nr:FkbM family methyltransferase [Scytonematopsis contorta HA4267-MV1]